MKILSILFSFALIECSVGAPVLGCSSELEGFKEVVKAKADIKASLVAALLGKHLQQNTSTIQQHFQFVYQLFSFIIVYYR